MQQGSSGSILSPLLISMLGILLTSLALVVYHFFLIKYCMSRHHTATTQPEPAAPSPTGIDDKLLQTIPVFTFSAVKRDMDQEECVVCLGELEDDDMVRLLPNCKHAFHLPCIDRCTRSSSSVPSPREQSFGLRHCASLVLPPPVDRRSLPRLKRSMSMDQSLVVINLQRVNCFSGPSSSSSRGRVLRRSGSCSTRSMSHFDRMPSMWLRSFSRLRSGKGNNGPILPY
ncbi:UNVERIFIED_CONTAM: RING-H2 finger protein ATL52 [Sesamum angustifolium]|uniref:RING-type E3 ubiquitin transferase n=1 Tax=Sesamum angustifolium TaxID=2727405 RepID=A0AAW2N646_9LAMI